MKLRIAICTHNGRTYFDRSGDHAQNQESVCLGACAVSVLENQNGSAKEFAKEAMMWRAIADFWVKRFQGRFTNAFNR